MNPPAPSTPPLPAPHGAPPVVLIEALATADAAGPVVSPGALLLRFDHPRIPHAATLLAAGTPAEVALHPLAAAARRVRLPRSVLIPGLVNAHTHLDLTHIGPLPHDPSDDGPGFVGWVDVIRTRRATEEAAIAESVRLGIGLSLAAGVVAVGDIAGAPNGRPSLVPWRTLRESPLLGVSFLEFFAIGRSETPRLESLGAILAEAAAEPGGPGSTEPDVARFGVQPHAPNTVGLLAYRWAAERAREMGLRLATHLAETIEERRFIGEAAGPQRELLERVGIWDDALLADIGRGRHPVEHVAEVLAVHPFAAAHVNDATDEAIEILARTGTTVAYCPRASTYFGAAARFGAHRYRDMLSAGVRVALGTDSVVNLHPWATDGRTVERLGPLDEMRLLHQRDATDPRTLLGMATTAGAAALGLEADRFTFAAPPRDRPRPIAGVVAIDLPEGRPERGEDPLAAALRTAGHPSLLSREIFCTLTRQDGPGQHS